MNIDVFRGFVSILGSKVVTLLLGLLVTPALVRLLGSTKYGDYAFVLSVLGITMILVNAGIFDGTRKYIAEDRERPRWPEHVFGFYLRTAALLAVVTAFGYVVFSRSGVPRRFLTTEFSTYLTLLGILVVGRQSFLLVRGGLMGLGLETVSEPLKVFKQVLFGVTAISLTAFGYGVVGVLAGHIAASFVASTVGFVVLSRHLNVRAVVGRLPSGLPRRELLSFNALSVVLILLTVSLYHVDVLLLKPIAGSRETGYYRAALVVAEFLWFVPMALQTALLQSSSELWSRGRDKRVATLVSRATRYNLSLTILLVLGLAALVGDFVPLYFGSEFEASVTPLVLLLPGALGFALARPIFAVGQGKGEIRVLVTATGSAALLNLVLNLLLIPRFGTAGAATATSIGYGSMLVFHVWAARRIGFDPIQDLKMDRILLVAGLTAPIIFGLSLAIDSSILSLVVVPPVGFIVYAALTLKFGVVTGDELVGIASRLPEPASRYSSLALEKLEQI